MPSSRTIFCFSLALPRRFSDSGPHSRLCSAFVTTEYLPSFSSQQHFSPSVPRRHALTCAYPRCTALSVDAFVVPNFANKTHMSDPSEIRTPEPTLVAFEGNHKTTEANGYKRVGNNLPFLYIYIMPCSWVLDVDA